MKQVWNLLQNSSCGPTKYLKGNHLLRFNNQVQPRCLNVLSPWFEVIISNSKMLVGSGSSVNFWCDNWTSGVPLLLRNSTMPVHFPKLSELLIQGQWKLQS
ncbi:unnamed protein product, partial [Ilex paraguariensis]